MDGGGLAGPLPAAGFAVMLEARAVSPVVIDFYDENLRVSATVTLGRDGSSDADTAQRLTHLLRCRFTGRERPIAQRTLAIIADVADRYEGKTIELVSAYRVRRGESRTSPHRHARAIDFRIRGVPLREIRDYLWRTYDHVGLGWYPESQFIHVDSRPSLHDTAWTFSNGTNHYHPAWAALARRPDAQTASSARRSGS